MESLGLLPAVLVFLLSLGVLLVAADRFVGAAEEIGLALGVPQFIIGISVVAIGTSFPELITAFFAVNDGHSEFVVGTVLGSNIANILLILGAATMMAKDFKITWDLLHGDLPLLFGSLLLLVFVIYPISTQDLAQFSSVSAAMAGGSGDMQGSRASVTMAEGVLLVGGYLLYLYYYALRNRDLADTESDRPAMRARSFIWLLAGGVGVVLGADYTVQAATALSSLMGIGAEIIAASLVAFGTSMPELVVCISAARRGNFEMALGNITGSNIFNTFMVLGLPALASRFMGDGMPLKAGDDSILYLQMPFYGATMLLFLVIVLDKTLTRTEGMVILMAYALFICKLFGFV